MTLTSVFYLTKSKTDCNSKLFFSLLVLAKERFINRLDADMALIKEQLRMKDMLMLDILRLMKPVIIAKLDSTKRQFEVVNLLDIFQ